MQRVESSWKWGSDNVVVSDDDITWAVDEPVMTADGTKVVVDSNDAWTYETVSNAHLAFPLCELPYITQRAHSGTTFPVPELNDGDINTCIRPRNGPDGDNMRLITKSLNASSERAALVKVHGEGIVCAAGQVSNFRVMNEINKDGNSIKYNMGCSLYAGYEMEGKQKCVFHCECPEGSTCEGIAINFADPAGIKICEFGVI
jgi:hypothetical protein